MDLVGEVPRKRGGRHEHLDAGIVGLLCSLGLRTRNIGRRYGKSGIHETIVSIFSFMLWPCDVLVIRPGGKTKGPSKVFLRRPQMPLCCFLLMVSTARPGAFIMVIKVLWHFVLFVKGCALPSLCVCMDVCAYHGETAVPGRPFGYEGGGLGRLAGTPISCGYGHRHRTARG